MCLRGGRDRLEYVCSQWGMGVKEEMRYRGRDVPMCMWSQGRKVLFVGGCV